MKNENAILNISEEDKDTFDKLNLDWNIKNKTIRKKKGEFFRMILNMFKEHKKIEKKLLEKIHAMENHIERLESRTK